MNTWRRKQIILKALAQRALEQGRLDDCARIMYLVEFGQRMPKGERLVQFVLWKLRYRVAS
jgi:hypothetical protein